MQAGRKAAAAGRRQESVDRVLDFRKWMDADVEYRRQYRDFVNFGVPVTARKPALPTDGVPSDYDYQVAREEGAIE